MNELYPLKFKPIFKDKIWGGDKIRTVLGLDFSPLPNCGEAWVLSGYGTDQSIVSNGFLVDNELNELVEVYMDDLVGGKVYEKTGDEFPLLVKFIHSGEWLSIQVHPDDDLARKRKLPHGKSEMWYIIDADENAQLISGFRKKITQRQYLQSLEEKKLTEYLNVEHAKAGEVFNLPAGRVHALGPGILLSEIQQTSDMTYRIYDWDRKDASGNSRELHNDLALEAIDFKVHDEYKTQYAHRLDETCNLITSPHFITNLLELARPLRKDYEELDSFVIFLCIEGNLGIGWENGEESLKTGEAMLIPAILDKISLVPATKSKILEIYID